MGFTIKLLIAYAVLFIIDGFALAYGLKDKKWLAFILISSAIALITLALGFLWITSPM